MTQTYKQREIDITQPVEMYRCLNRKGNIYSLRQRGLVVAHTSQILLRNCELVINPAGKRRCITTGQRNVHAFVKGYLCEDPNREFVKRPWNILKYNPYSNEGFIGVEDIDFSRPVFVALIKGKVLIRN